MLDRNSPKIDLTDLDLYHVTDSIEEAVEIILNARKQSLEQPSMPRVARTGEGTVMGYPATIYEKAVEKPAVKKPKAREKKRRA